MEEWEVKRWNEWLSPAIRWPSTYYLFHGWDVTKNKKVKGKEMNWSPGGRILTIYTSKPKNYYGKEINDCKQEIDMEKRKKCGWVSLHSFSCSLTSFPTLSTSETDERGSWEER